MRSINPGLVVVAYAGLISSCLAFLLPGNDWGEYDAEREFDWNDIKPSRHLEYHKCYGSFDCARLEVPVDWSNLSNPNTVAIAITRLRAVVDETDDSFGGTVVINPGGPSGSGVTAVLWGGESLQDIVDSDKHFEILSFDPRGVQFTTPSLECFQADDARMMLNFMRLGAGSLESNQHALETGWSIDKSIGLLCAQTENGRFPDGSNIRQYVSTALVAHDMVAIIDQVNALRQQERTLRSRNREQQALIVAGAEGDPALLNYWGLSYGTYLGNTFASMFPDRIGRMLLDGVVDADDYAATGWTSNLQDNNKTWETFFEYCFEAREACALCKPSTRDPSVMQNQVEAFLADLQHNPLAMVQDGNAYVLTYFATKTLIHVFMYQPIQLWPLLAYLLQAFIERNMENALSALKTSDTWLNRRSRGFAPVPLHQTSRTPMPWDSLLMQDLPSPAGYAWAQEAAISILCGDGASIASRTKSDFADYLALLEAQSPLVGSLWAEITLPCIHWGDSIRPSDANRFAGPFASNLSDYDPRGSPLLFIGNTADPVTPVRNAHKMAEAHEGSVVLTQDMPGHCAGSTNPSVCTFEVIKAFFANGTLSEKGRVCEAALKPWGL